MSERLHRPMPLCLPFACAADNRMLEVWEAFDREPSMWSVYSHIPLDRISKHEVRARLSVVFWDMRHTYNETWRVEVDASFSRDWNETGFFESFEIF